MSGGEIAAMVVTDGLARFVPGLLGGETSAEDDSFSDGLLKHTPSTLGPKLGPDARFQGFC